MKKTRQPQTKPLNRSAYGDFSQEQGQEDRGSDLNQQEKTQEQLMRQKIGQQLEYINKNINPILSKMMIKIINQNPIDLIQYMIQYLKNEQAYQTNNHFQNQLSKTISPNKRIKNQSRVTTNKELKMVVSSIQQE